MNPIAPRPRAGLDAFVVVCLFLVVLFFKTVPTTEAVKGDPALAPIIGVTKTAALVAGNGDADADPGDTIEYTITINNTGPDPGTNVVVNDTLQNIQTLVGGSLAVSPIAVNDTYASIGNVGITVPDGVSDLLANDTNPGGGGTLAIVAPVPTTSTQGGNVAINTTTGSFTYNPAPGFEGTDTFVYTLGNGSGLTNTATVTINVTGMIWFVQTGAAAGGDGRLGTPFNCFVGVNCFDDTTLDAPADNIFLYTGAYIGGQTLLASQRLVGQGVTIPLAGPGSITGIAIPPFSNSLPTTGGARPTMTTTLAATSALTLGSGNTLRGFNIGDTTAADITGTGFGTLTASEMDLNGTGRPLVLTTGTLAATFGTLTSTSSAGGAAVSLTTVGGTLTAASAVLTGGVEGINLNAMSGTVTLTTVSINGQSGDGINVTNSTGTTNINGGTIGNTNDPAGNCVEVNGSNGNVTIAAALAKTTAGKIVLVTNRTGNTVTLSGNISATGAVDNGIDVNTNTAGIVNFTGQTQTLTTGGNTGVNLFTNGTGVINFAPATGGNGLDIATTSGLGFRAQTNGTVTVQGSGNSITAGTGTALNVTSAAIGALNMIFQSISAANGANGIVLDTTTGSSGGLIVNGDGTNTTVGGNATGGTLSGMAGGDGGSAGNAIYMNNTSGHIFRRMLINGTNQNHGIRGIGASNITIEFTTVTGTNGTSTAVDEGSVNFDNLTGSAAITSCVIEGGFEDNLNVVNTSGTLNRLTISGSTFGFNNTANGNNNILIESQNAGTTLNFTLKSSLIKGARADWINFANNSGSTGDSVIGGPLVADGNTFDNLAPNNHPGSVAGGNRVVFGGVGNSTVDVRNNTTRGSRGEAIRIRSSAAPGPVVGTVNARVRNNTIGVQATANSGSSEGAGIFVFGDGGSDMNIAVTNNTVRQYNNHGIRLLLGDEINDGSAFNATVTGNTVGTPGSLLSDFNGILFTNGSVSATDNFTTCADIGGAGALANTITGSGSGTIPPNNQEFRLQQRFATTVRLPGYAGAATDTAAVIAFIQGRNIVTAGNGAASTQAPGGGFLNTLPGGTPCTQPPFATLENRVKDDNLAFMDLPSPYQPSVTSVFEVPRSESEALNTTFVKSFAPYLGGDATAIESAVLLESPEVRAGSSAFVDNGTSVTADGSDRTGTLLYSRVPVLVHRLAEMISPTVYAQKEEPPKGGTEIAPESGETITVPAFTLPAGETITVRFRSTVDNGPFASGVNNITNTVTVTADGGISVPASSTPIALDAAPDLQVTVSDGGTTTQPGVVVQYTTTYQNNTAINGQNAAAVRITQTVPTNTTFNATVSGAGWSCPDGSIGGTVCTFDVGAVNAGAPAAALNFAVNVLPALPAGAVQISDTATIAENPVNANGTDRVPANNTSNDTTNIIGNWDGSTSTAWAVNTNWSNDVTPPAGNNVSIPDVANAPLITTAVPLNNLVLNGENLTIDAPGAVTLSGNLTLGANIIGGTGQINLGTASAINRTTGQINCTLQKNFAGVGPAFLMPIGTTGAFSPLNVTVTNGAGQLTARANVPFQPALSTISTRVLQRYWTLSGSGIRSNITFNYLTADVPGAPNNENIWTVIRVTGTTIVRYTPGPDIVMNPGANTFTVNNLESYSDWTAGEPLAPTAANAMVSGRVTDTEGRGVAGALVSMQDQAGNAMWAVTNPFGYYRFASVPTGQQYLIAPRHKRFTFEPRSISVNDDVTGVDFIPSPLSP